MKNLKYVKKFIFDVAKYHLSDSNGDKAMLKINYKNNNYSVKFIGNKINQNFRAEAHQIAETLLKRKSGINRVKAIKL